MWLGRSTTIQLAPPLSFSSHCSALLRSCAGVLPDCHLVAIWCCFWRCLWPFLSFLATACSGVSICFVLTSQQSFLQSNTVQSHTSTFLSSIYHYNNQQNRKLKRPAILIKKCDRVVDVTILVCNQLAPLSLSLSHPIASRFRPSALSRSFLVASTKRIVERLQMFRVGFAATLRNAVNTAQPHTPYIFIIYLSSQHPANSKPNQLVSTPRR